MCSFLGMIIVLSLAEGLGTALRCSWKPNQLSQLITVLAWAILLLLTVPPNTLLEYFQFSLPFQAFSSPYQTVNLDYRFKLTMLPQMIADGTLS